LYRSFTVTETMRFARETNPGWDEAFAVDLLTGLEADRRVSALNAGERARLALAVALGKRPALLLLDEPFARLDPLAAREFLQMLMDGVAVTGATAVIASHVVADIERVADHIVLLSGGRVRLQGRVEELLGSHRLLTGARRPLGRIAGVAEVVRQRHSGRQLTLLARIDGRIVEPSWSIDEIGLEELLLAYMAPERLPQRPAAEQGRLRWHG
jgi:ABC-2 type transport system ATP-binding protein